MRLSAGRSIFAISTPVAAKIGSSHFKLLGRTTLREQLSIHARIARLRPGPVGKPADTATRIFGDILCLWLLLIFPPALRIRPCRSVVLRFASAQRMSRPSERMMSLGHELRRTDEQRTRKKPGSACDSVSPHDFQNSYQTQMHSQPQALGWIIVKTQNLMKTGFGGHQFRQPVA